MPGLEPSCIPEALSEGYGHPGLPLANVSTGAETGTSREQFKLHKIWIAPWDDYCPSLKKENQVAVPLMDAVKYLLLERMHLGLSKNIFD